MIDEGQIYDYAVIGGGVHGLSAAYYLSKTQAKVALFEQFTIGHNFGSSHGETRITRSIYSEKFYSELVGLCNKECWPEMENILNSKLLYENEFVAFTRSSEEIEKLRELCEAHKDIMS